MAIVKVALATGHSNHDPGAIAMHLGITYKERDLNVALVREIMKATPINAYFWKPDVDCVDLEYPAHLKKRVLNINREHDVACAVSIHHNSCGNPKRKGAEIIYWDTSESGYLLARYITQELVSIPMKAHVLPAVKQLGRKLYFLRKTRCPAVIVEPVFMSNEDDLNFAISHRVQIAVAVRHGVNRWVKETYND